MNAGPIPAFRQAIFDTLETRPAILLAHGHSITNDDRLAELTQGTGQLANVLWSPRQQLERIAAYCVGWLSALGVDQPFSVVHAERERQGRLRKRFPKKYLVWMDSAVTDVRRKLRIVVEEQGEVANAIDLIERGRTARRQAHLIAEISHVAAVCVAWLETPEVKP